jgi:hypothetical protein
VLKCQRTSDEVAALRCGVNSRTQFEGEGLGVIRDCPLACQHGADGAVVPQPTEPDHLQQVRCPCCRLAGFGSRDAVSEFSRARRTFWPLASRVNIDEMQATLPRPEPAADTGGDFIGG